MKITVKDMNNVIHKKCPRCRNKWELLEDSGEYIVCSKCGMMACRQDSTENQYFLTFDIEVNKRMLSIYWYGHGCVVSHDYNESEDVDLPPLPFDISSKKLATYLTFS